MHRRSTGRTISNPFAKFRRRYVADLPTVHVAAIDKDFRIISHSSAWDDWLGETPLDGRDVRDVLGTEASRAFRGSFDAALAGRPARKVASLHAPPLGPRTIDLSCVPHVLETGERRGFFVLASEIPSLKESKETGLERFKREGEALSESQYRLRLAVETAEVGTWDWDLRTGSCSWNAHLGRLWGLKPAAQGDRGIFLANIHPEDRGRVEQTLEDLLRAGTESAVSFEFRVISPLDSTERWLSVHSRIVRGSTGEPLRLIGTAMDVSARREVEAELEYRRTMLEAETEAALDGILVVDPEGRMVAFNRRFVTMWNIPPHVVASRSDDAAIASVLHSLASPDEFLDQVRYLYTHPGEESRDELRLKDGRIFDRYSAPVQSAAGVNYGRVWFFRDVTEQKRNEQALHERTALLEEALLELNTFAYSVAHDLRAPLRAIAGFSDMLQEDYGEALVPPAREYTRRISDNAKRMDNLITDLLTYSRLTRELMPDEHVNLESLLREILSRFGPEIRQSGAQIDVSGPLPPVVAHRISLDQVISNLLSNAIKFVIPGTPPRIRIFTQEKEDRVLLWVEDNGIGIAPEYQERIFGVFQRLHSLSDYSGTGIGLAIVRRAMERMGGRVGVESEPGKGSRFWIELKPAPTEQGC